MSVPPAIWMYGYAPNHAAALRQRAWHYLFGAPLRARIDVLSSIDGVTFEEAWAERMTANFVDLQVPVLSARHLIQNKRAVGCAQDIADVEALEKLRNRSDPPAR